MVAKRRIFIWVPKHYEKKLEIASKSHLLRGGYPTCKLAKAEKVGNDWHGGVKEPWIRTPQ